MPTLKQRAAIAFYVENGGNLSKAMRDAGYSPATAKNPQKLRRSKGFMQLFEDSGLSRGMILESLKRDIENNPGSRVRELALAAKILGMTDTPLQKVNITTLEKNRILDLV